MHFGVEQPLQEFTLLSTTHPVVGPPFRYRECAGRRRSLKAAIVKKARLWLWFLHFVKYIRTNCFDICFCVKSIVIKLLRTMVLYPCALCLSMDKWTLCGHFCSYIDPERS